MNEQTNSNLDTHLQDTLAWNRDGGVVFSSAPQSLAPQGRYYVPFTDATKVKISVIPQEQRNGQWRDPRM
jgi:hypothetical protein